MCILCRMDAALNTLLGIETEEVPVGTISPQLYADFDAHYNRATLEKAEIAEIATKARRQWLAKEITEAEVGKVQEELDARAEKAENELTTELAQLWVRVYAEIGLDPEGVYAIADGGVVMETRDKVPEPGDELAAKRARKGPVVHD